MSNNGGTEYDHFKCVILINLLLDKLIKPARDTFRCVQHVEKRLH